MDYKYIFIRAFAAILILTIMTINSITNFAITNEFPTSIVDYTQNLFKGFHHFFEINKNTKKFFLISIGVILDFSILFLSYAWIKFSKSWRSLIILITYIFIQCVSKFLFKIKIPEGNLMQYPGIPSLLISYNETNNFFFGSIGLSLFAAIELKAYNNIHIIFRIMSWLSFINIPLQIFVYYSLKSIYLIDIICPIVSLLYCIVMTKSMCKYFDENLVISHDEISDEKELAVVKIRENVIDQEVINIHIPISRESNKSTGSNYSNVTIVAFDAAVNPKGEKIEMESYS